MGIISKIFGSKGKEQNFTSWAKKLNNLFLASTLARKGDFVKVKHSKEFSQLVNQRELLEDPDILILIGRIESLNEQISKIYSIASDQKLMKRAYGKYLASVKQARKLCLEIATWNASRKTLKKYRELADETKGQLNLESLKIVNREIQSSDYPDINKIFPYYEKFIEDFLKLHNLGS